MKYVINIDLTNPIYANDREVDYVDNDTGMKWTISKTGLKKMKPLEDQIIRCKDCRWRKDQSGSTAWLPCREIVTPSDFYCGRAERRTDE